MAKLLMVVGFIFSANQVVLIQKKTPKNYEGEGRLAFMDGKYNGLGGVVKTGETAVQCLIRKVQAECGLLTNEKQWEGFHEWHTDDAIILFARCYLTPQALSKCISPTDEHVSLIDVDKVNGLPCIPNVPWLIMMAQDRSHNFSITTDFTVQDGVDMHTPGWAITSTSWQATRPEDAQEMALPPVEASGNCAVDKDALAARSTAIAGPSDRIPADDEMDTPRHPASNAETTTENNAGGVNLKNSEVSDAINGSENKAATKTTIEGGDKKAASTPTPKDKNETGSTPHSIGAK